MGLLKNLFGEKPPEVKSVESLYAKPHKKLSRGCTQEDVKRILKDAQLMYELCFAPVGNYKSAYAIAHPQITDKDPLAFYVTKERHIIINPRIVRITEHKRPMPEGCMSFPTRPAELKLRSYKCEVEYQTIDGDGKLTEPHTFPVKGIQAQIVQHEIDHLNGKTIYDEN